MLQPFLQILDRSTATRRGRFHFKETSFHDAETPLFNTDWLSRCWDTNDQHCWLSSDAETPPFSTLDFPPDTITPPFKHSSIASTAESPPFPTFEFLLLLKIHYQQPFIIFSDAETPLFSTFSSHSQNTTVHHFLTILHRRNNSVQQLFRLSLSVVETPLQQLFTISWCWNTIAQHCWLFPRCWNTIVQHFFFPLPKHYSPPFPIIHHWRNNFVQQLFRLSPSVAETPLTATLHHFLPDVETPPFNTFDFLPMLKHHSSAVLHL